VELENCTGAVTGTNPRVSAGFPRERERMLRKTRGNDGNGNDFCGNTAGTGPNFTWITANTNSARATVTWIWIWIWISSRQGP